jgi:excinuclease ABC subunit C
MRSLAAEENFEAAGRRRDQVKALDVLEQRQRVLGPEGWDRVAVSLWRDGDRIAVALTQVSDGAVSQVQTYLSVDDPMLSDDEAMTLVLPSLDLGDVRPLTSQTTALSRKARGDRERGLLAFTLAQARAGCEREITPTRDDPSASAEALARLALLLGVSGPLRRIECMDISHTQGRYTVGSVVVFHDGVARREEFRVVHLQDVDGDDYAAMRELVTRRTSGRRLGLVQLPDLLLIDGGPGQVAAALDALNTNSLIPVNHNSGRAASSADASGSAASSDSINVAHSTESTHGPETGPALAGLAKRFEEIWPVNATRPVLIGAHDPVLHLLTSVRDHAHRHALDANRRRRERDALRTGLDSIPGVGSARRRALLARFGTLDAVARAPVEELEGVTGVGPQLARRIVEHFSGLHEGYCDPPGPQ